MLEFKTVRLEDMSWYKELADRANDIQPRLNLDAPFALNYIWRNRYGIKICRFEDFILKAYFRKDGAIAFTFPYGVGDVDKALRAIEAYAGENNLPLLWGSLSLEQTEIINSCFGGRFSFASCRDYSEYIYESERLAYLPGRKLHSKRNHLKRFEASYSYSFEQINNDNKEEAYKVAQHWCAESSADGCKDDSEFCAIRDSIDNFDALGLEGAIIRIDGKAVAMTIGEEVSKAAFVTHFEKALSGYDGLYTAINCYFARALKDRYKYINREEDLGIEGLRKSKLSYRPDILLERFEGCE